MTTIKLSTGVNLNILETQKFKTSFIGISFLCPLKKGENTKNALIPRVLQGAGEKYPDLKSLNMALDELYGAELAPMARKRGEVQAVGFAMNFIEDRYALKSEPIACEAIELLGEVLLKPKTLGDGFLPHVVEVEKKNQKERLEARINDKLRYGIERCHEIMCKDEPFSLSAGGEVADIEEITPKGLYSRYLDMIKTAPVEIYYIGGADQKIVSHGFMKMFSSLEREEGDIPKTAAGPAGEPKAEEEIMDVAQCKLTMGFRTPITAADERYFALALACAVYGGGPLSKLFMNVRERLSLCYYASASLEKNKGIVTVYSGVDGESLDKARDEVLAQLNDLKEGRMTADELENARRVVINSLKSATDSPFAMEDFALGEMLAGTSRSPEDCAAELLKVTAAQVIEAARTIELDTVFVIRGEER